MNNMILLLGSKKLGRFHGTIRKALEETLKENKSLEVNETGIKHKRDEQKQKEITGTGFLCLLLRQNKCR